LKKGMNKTKGFLLKKQSTTRGRTREAGNPGGKEGKKRGLVIARGLHWNCTYVVGEKSIKREFIYYHTEGGVGNTGGTRGGMYGEGDRTKGLEIGLAQGGWPWL